MIANTTKGRRIFRIGGLNLEPRRRSPERSNPLWLQEAASRTRYRYDDLGQLVERVDVRGYSTFYAYDGFGRLIEVTHPDGAALLLAYDAAGQLCRRVLPNGDACSFQSKSGRLQAVEFSAGDAIRFAYDHAGRLAHVAEPGCVTFYTYPAQGRLLHVRRTVDQTQFRYDYDATGQLGTLHLPNQVTIDLAGLPTLHAPPAVVDEPVRDANGNVIAFEGSEYYYEEPHTLWSRLLEARHPRHGRTRYQYDAGGNRTARLDAVGETSYTYDSRNRLAHAVYPDGSVTHLEYDANGNLTGKLQGQATWHYGYNGRQQLVRIDRNGQLVARYRYDFQGRRIWRQVGEEVTLYHYDETGYLIAVTNADGAPIVVFTYSAGPPVAHCFSATGAVQSYLLSVDHLGSTRRITDADGRIIWQGEFTPFGRLRGEPPAFPCPLFAGQLWDPESGFYFCQSRYFDPEVGRFITPDPWTHAPDDARLLGQHTAAPVPAPWLTQPELAHPYVYCLNNPLTHRDPAGLSVGLTILRTILAIFWSSPWTIFGFALALVDALLQFAILGALFLPRFGLDRTSSGRIGSAALLKIGGLFNFQFAWANVIFVQRGRFDELDDTKQQHIIPTEAHRTPRELRTEKRAYLDYLLRHTVLANYFGPIWPPVYLFGGFIPLRKNAVRESGYSPIDDPVLTIAPDKIFSRADCFLIAIGGKKPYTAQLSDATAGAITPFVDQPAFSEARFQPQYVPGEHKITLRDKDNADDTREIKIVAIEVDDITAKAPAHLLVDKLSNPPTPVLRLVNREAGTVEFDIDPKQAVTFYEVFEPDPLDPAARAADLSRTTGTGDTQVTVTPHSSPGPIGRFMELDPAFQATLDLAVLSPDLQHQLQTNGVRLTPAATIVVRGAGLLWQVLDGVQVYTIRRIDPFVYDARGYRLFTLNSISIPDLDSNNLSATLRTAFTNQGIALTPAAVLSTQLAGSQWRIVDGAQTYNIRGQHRLSVFESFGSHAPLEYTVRVKTWDVNGIVIKTMQVRSLGMINVTLQAHIVRDDNGNRPAATEALLEQLRVRINEVWRQAGIQFFWRAERQFIDEEDFLTIRIDHPTLPDTYPDMFLWRPTPPAPWPAAAHTNHHDQDPRAIHIYFINDFDQPAGDKKTLAFVPTLGTNAVVMPKIADADDLAHELGHTMGLPHPDQTLPAPPEAEKRVMFSVSSNSPGQRFLIANHEPAREGPGRLAPGDPSSDETRHARATVSSHMGP